MDTELFGNSNFLESTALPNPVDAADVIIRPPNGQTAVFVALTRGTSAFEITGSISSVQSRVAPEPSTLLLLATVGLALLLVRTPILRRRFGRTGEVDGVASSNNDICDLTGGALNLRRKTIPKRE